MDGAVENKTMPLIVIGPAIILPDVEIVDRRAEEELSHIVQSLRVRVRDTIIPPARRALHEGNMQAVVMGIGERRILTVVPVVGIRPASIVASGGDTSWNVLIDRDNQMQTAHMLIAHAQRFVAAKLSLDFKVGLLRIRILHVTVHRGEVEQDARWKCQAAEDIRKFRSARLPGRKADADLAEVGDFCRVPGGKQRICQCSQRDAVIEEPIAPADHRVLRSERRPRQAHTRRNVVRVRHDRFQELQVVADSKTQCQTRSRLPFVLRIKTGIRIGLRDN